jgi:hypothetical protein
VAPAVELAAGVEGGFEHMVEHRAVVAAAHVVLAQPDQLDRRLAADRLDDLRGLDDVVGTGAGAAAEAAAGVEHVDLHLLRP